MGGDPFALLDPSARAHGLRTAKLARPTCFHHRHFLATYPRLVTSCKVTVKEDIWNRVLTADTAGDVREHKHAFVKAGPQVLMARCHGTRDAHGLVSLRVFGGIKGFTILKTTQSSFADFHKDNNTTLPEASDRCAVSTRSLGIC